MPADPEIAVKMAGEGGFQNSGGMADPHLLFLGDIFATPEWFPLYNVYSVGDAVDRARRADPAARRVRHAPRAPPLAGGRPRGGLSAARRAGRRSEPAVLHRPRAVVPRLGARPRGAAPAGLLAHRVRLGGDRRARARPAAVDPLRPAARRAGGPRRLADVRDRRRPAALPRLHARRLHALAAGADPRRRAGRHRRGAVLARRAGRRLAPGARRPAAGGARPVRRARRSGPHRRPRARRRPARGRAALRPARRQRGLVRALRRTAGRDRAAHAQRRARSSTAR